MKAKTITKHLFIGVLLTLVAARTLASSLTVPASDSDGTFTITLARPASGYYNSWQVELKVGTSTWTSQGAKAPGSHPITVAQSGQYYVRARPYNPWISIYGSPPGPIYGQWVVEGPVAVTIQTIPHAPGTLSASDGSTSYDGTYTISWGAAVGQVDYYKWRENNGSWNNVGTSRTTPALTRGNGAYTYNVQACNSLGCSGSSSKTVSVDKNIGPTISRSTATSTSGNYTLSWTAGRINGKAVEHVWIYENGSPTLVYGRNSSTNHITNIAPWTRSQTTQGSWTYSVRACINVTYVTGGAPWPNSGTCINTGATTVTVDFPTPGKVGTVSAVLGATFETNGRVDLSWASMPNASKYEIRYGTAGTASTSKTKITTTNTSKTITSLQEGNWEFEVRACNGVNECGAYSGMVSRTVQFAPAITLTEGTADAINGNVSLYWTLFNDPQPGLSTAHRVYRNGSVIATLDKHITTYVVPDLQSGIYTFSVAKCIGTESDCSWKSNPVTVEVFRKPSDASPPQITGLENGVDLNGSFAVTWTPLLHAARYHVYYSANDRVEVTGSSTILNLDIGVWKVSVQGCSSPTVCGARSPEVMVKVIAKNPSVDESYLYDPLGRLQEVTYDNGVKEKYELDPQDNRQQVKRSAQ